MLIKVFGLRRSGNHAVINWLLGLLDAPLFFNDVRLYRNPLTDFGPVTVPEGVRVTHLRRDGKRVPTGVTVVPHGGEAANGHVVCSYEHADMASLDMQRLDRSIAAPFGPYAETHNIVILRNPLNVFASYLALKLQRKGKPRPRRLRFYDWIGDRIEATLDQRIGLSVRRLTRPERELVVLWKTYAALALAPDSPTRGSFIPVVFDRFVMDREYRDAIARRLGLDNADRNLDFVSRAGRGSSFDGLSKPDPGKLLLRWQSTDASARLRPYVTDDLEFQDYCLRLFDPAHLDPSLFRALPRDGGPAT